MCGWTKPSSARLPMERMRGAPVEALTVVAQQDGAFSPFPDGKVDGAGGARHQGDEGWLVALAHDAQDPMSPLECRPPWRPGFGPDWTRFPIARLRYTKTRNKWSLYWRDRDLRFHLDDLVAPSSHVEDMLAEVERDATGIFWG
jgi:hypothetical protein